MLRRGLLVFSCMFLCTHANADPGFPANLGAEASWPDGPAAFHPIEPVTGVTYYVDGLNGLDTNDGTDVSPFKTITRALEVISSGDTVVVKAGVYHEQIIPTKDMSLSRGQAVTLLADPPNGLSVVIDGTNMQPAIEDGSNRSTGAGVSLFKDSSFVVVGFLVQNWTGYGLAIEQSSFNTVSNCTFRNNGTGMNDSVDMVVISSRDVKVFGNTFDSGTERALDDRSTDTWILGNYFSGHAQNAVKIGIPLQEEDRGCRVEHNVFLDNPATQGVIRVHDTRGVTVQRNLVVRGNLQGIRLDALDDSLVLLNTVVGFQIGIEISSLQGCRLEGNILSGNTLGVEILIMTASLGLDGNLYYGNTLDVEGGDAGPGAYFQDPGFNNAGGDDYTLGAGSQSIDKGPEDLPVPVGGGSRVDLGAFETGAGDAPWEYQPVGQVADFTPKFLWEYINRDGVAQGSYRVQVDPVPTFDSQDLLDSNWQESGDAHWTVPYGFELDPGDWYVRVKMQDAGHTQGPWSDPHTRFTVVTPDTCASQDGKVCAALDTCGGQWLVTSDENRCCLGTCISCVDDDADGHPAESCGGGDCDDSDAGIHPGAEEDCQDSVDNDCDGLTDLDDSDSCACIDHDRDGYGENCAAGEDCDDGFVEVHPGAEEKCNYIDDDCDGETDEGFDLQIDPDNCGECGWECRESIPEVCDRGECETECGGGRTDCDRSCVDTQADENNCGACGAVCDIPNAGERCSEGVCVLTVCEAGWVDLNGSIDDGCEYECTPSAAGEEECGNSMDDDCDGEIDESCEERGCSCRQDASRSSMWLVVIACALLLRRRSRARTIRSRSPL